MLGRRFLLLVAVLMGLTALAASVAPREPLIREGARRTATPTPTPTPPQSAAAGEPLKIVQKTLEIGVDPVPVIVREGQQVELTVKGTELDNVMLLDHIEPIEADSPAIFDFLADTHGRYPITLIDSGRKIGTLVVQPRAS
jgi:hypothetical protein